MIEPDASSRVDSVLGLSSANGRGCEEGDGCGRLPPGGAFDYRRVKPWIKRDVLGYDRPKALEAYLH